MEILAEGAEARIIRDGDKVIKKRLKKRYRHPILDERIRKERTRREARLLLRAAPIVNVPKVLELREEEDTLILEYIPGTTLKDYLRSGGDPSILREVGRIVGSLHRSGIIHGDLTTSNFILSGERIYLIDFGLGKVSRSVEDRAVDLVCFKKSFTATHPEEDWSLVLEDYREVCREAEKVFRRMEAVERRARYL